MQVFHKQKRQTKTKKYTQIKKKVSEMYFSIFYFEKRKRGDNNTGLFVAGK